MNADVALLSAQACLIVAGALTAVNLLTFAWWAKREGRLLDELAAVRQSNREITRMMHATEGLLRRLPPTVDELIERETLPKKRTPEA